jgi:hypothetical protein
MRNSLGYLRHHSVNWLCLETVFVVSLVVNWGFVIMGRETCRYVAGHHVALLSLGVYLYLCLKPHGVKFNPYPANVENKVGS